MRDSDRQWRDDEDVAVVLALLGSMTQAPVPPAPQRTAWGDPGFTLTGRRDTGPDAWWASALAR